ncbi:hypothetical protein Y032_0005g2579 [Ancylostoma ceylanicum]|uniref:Uncharacterized protein n=1 Tax=Ancylostoma ceylanicum TaxID=53326 RepID=A0A016VSD1_9BILA|nr:hypothetical protein Y032_0005g2579 [Ancylostoma ceylanicum]
MSTFPDKGQLLQAPRHPESPNQQLSRKWLQRTFLVLLALGEFAGEEVKILGFALLTFNYCATSSSAISTTIKLSPANGFISNLLSAS